MKSDLYSHILVRLQRDENFIIIRTYQRGIGRKGRFFISRKHLRKWLVGDRKYPFYDMDCGDVLTIRGDGDDLDFRMYWLSNSYGKLLGDEQMFSIPMELMWDVVDSETSIRYLHVPKPCNSKIELHVSHEMMENILRMRKTRHAFRSAMKNAFKWRDEIIHLYPDGGADFFFRTASGSPACGGLILHETTVENKRGGFPAVGYSVHT